MTDLSTVTYGFVKPTNNADADTWGTVLNGTLDLIDSTISTANLKLTNVSTSTSALSSSLSNTSTSVSQVSSSLSGAISTAVLHSTSLSQLSSSLSGAISTAASQSTSLSQISSSLSNANTSVANTSTSVSNIAASQTNVSTSLGNVSTSLANVSTSFGNASTSLGNVSSSLANVSSSLTNVSTSLGSALSGTNANTIGYLGLPQVTQSANYTAVLADAGKEQFFTASGKTGTVPSNASVAYQIGTILVWAIESGTLTVAINSDTLEFVPSGSTGSRTITGPGFMTARKITSTKWWGYGLGVT